MQKRHEGTNKCEPAHDTTALANGRHMYMGASINNTNPLIWNRESESKLREKKDIGKSYAGDVA